MMEVEICGDAKFNPEVWDYLMNSFSKVKNIHYSKIVVEMNKKTLDAGSNMFKRNDNISLRFAVSGKYTDLIAVDKGQEIRLVLVELNAKDMKKDGWKPIFNSKKNVIFMWVKPSFMISCIDLSGVPFTKPVKGLIDLFVKTANKMKKHKVTIDLSKVEKELSLLMNSTKKKEYENAKTKVSDVLDEVSYFNAKLADVFSSLVQAKETLNIADKLRKKKVNVKGILDNVLKIEGVRFVTVENGEIVVITNSLKSLPFTRFDRKRTIDLGSYKISWGKGKQIKIHNIDKASDYDYDHPHIKNGVPCWGNMSEITKYAQEFNVEITIQMILSYLVNINPDGWHRNGVDWANEFRDG